MKKEIGMGIGATILFLVVSLLTLGNYGVSWDEALHYRRGQAYLHYYLTCNTGYEDMRSQDVRRSIYQSDRYNMNEILKIDGAHGPLSDQLAAMFNYVWYQKLGLAGDIEAHHIYVVLASSVMVLVVVTFAAEVLGMLAAGVAFLALVTYPLYWSEAHFNIKDPVQAAYFSGVLWAFWKGRRTGSVRWLGVLMLMGILALGTKINIIFAPVILGLYLLVGEKRNLPKVSKKFWAILAVSPLVMMAGVYILWPFLWGNILGGIIKVLTYYKNIGTGFDYQDKRFYILGINTYALRWIIVTTPLMTLLLVILGLGFAWRYRKMGGGAVCLWVIWLLIPILRVSLPGMSIYGGVRQIMEFVPAMALMAGVGVEGLVRLWGGKRAGWVVGVVVVLGYLATGIGLARWHPYENTYFNMIIGGLKGAKENNFPAWGNSFGLAYKEGIEWLNQNAEEGAKMSLIQGTTANIPEIWLRSDINFDNANFSGIERGGEYLMELTFNDTAKSYYYVWEYVEKFLRPVYEVKVDGVAILKIWKNDIGNTRDEWRVNETDFKETVNLVQERNMLVATLKEEKMISRLRLIFESNDDCFPIETGFVELSIDGETWVREGDWIPFAQVGRVSNLGFDRIEFFVAGKRAKYVRFVVDSTDSCVMLKPKLFVTFLDGDN